MGSERIARSDSCRATTGRELNTRDAALDSRLAGAGLEEADTNGDGVIRGEQELHALFDRLTRSPRRARRARASASRTMLAGLAAHMNAPGLGGLVRRPERAQHEAIVVPRMAPLLDVFPNLDSAWGYSGFSPSGRAAQRHQAIWERETHGLPKGGGGLRRSMAHGTRRGEAVSVWTRAHGLEGPTQGELHDLHIEIVALRPLYADLLAGRVAMSQARHRDLTRLYARLQQITAHTDYREQTDDFREDHDRMRGVALRLRFFPSVASHFAQKHAAAARQGYAALELTPPDFANMTRPQTMRAIDELEARVDENSPAASRRLARLLRRGLGELRESEISAQWTE